MECREWEGRVQTRVWYQTKSQGGNTGLGLQVSSKQGLHLGVQVDWLSGKTEITPGSKVIGCIYCLLVEGCPQALEVLPVLREGSC